jgi:hypothetical protein
MQGNRHDGAQSNGRGGTRGQQTRRQPRAGTHHHHGDGQLESASLSVQDRHEPQVSVQCQGCGQRFESAVMLRRHRNNGRLSRGALCRAAMPGLPQRYAEPVRHSSARNNRSISGLGADIAGMGSDDDAAQEHLQPSMQVKT